MEKLFEMMTKHSHLSLSVARLVVSFFSVSMATHSAGILVLFLFQLFSHLKYSLSFPKYRSGPHFLLQKMNIFFHQSELSEKVIKSVKFMFESFFALTPGKAIGNSYLHISKSIVNGGEKKSMFLNLTVRKIRMPIFIVVKL